MTFAAETPPAAEPSAPPRDPAAYARRRPLLGAAFWMMIVFGLACALGGAAFAWFAPRWFPAAQTAAAPPPAPQAPAPVTPAAPVVLAPAPLPPAAPSAEVVALQDRVVALESAQTRTANAAAAALAASALLDASRASRPFVAELAVVERLLPPTPEMAALRRHAQSGAPSRAVLSDDFEAAAARAALAARAPTDGARFIDQIAYAFGSIISVRRVGVTTGDAPDAVLARAEELVADGDLEAALTTLDALPPRARDAMAAWRGRAERRAEIDRAVAAIRAGALANLSQAQPTLTQAQPPLSQAQP